MSVDFFLELPRNSETDLPHSFKHSHLKPTSCWEKTKRICLAILKTAPFFCLIVLTPPVVALVWIVTVIILDASKNKWYHVKRNGVYVLNGTATGLIGQSILTLAKVSTIASLIPLLVLKAIQVTAAVYWMYRARSIARGETALKTFF